MDRHPDRHIRTASVFLRAAVLYWGAIWPRANREIARLRARAAEIEDPMLRAAALLNLTAERGNLEGAAAFAVLAPPGQRRQLLSALIAFQAIYDYVDTLAEQPEFVCDETRNRRTHAALRDALTHEPEATPPSAYLDDGGYLTALVGDCRASIAGLRGAAAIVPHALQAVEGMIEYQARNHAPADAPAVRLAAWQHASPIGSESYDWWEAAASAASSLVVFALLALGTDPSATRLQADDVVHAYVPFGALHVLLDSYADRDADVRTGDHSLIAHFPDRTTETERLTELAAQARSRLSLLHRHADLHLLILSAMSSFYLTGSGHDRRTADQVADVLGPFARATNIVLRARARCRHVDRGTIP